MKEKLCHIYEHHYKKLMLIPIALVLFAIIQISVQYAQTGDFVNRGISLKGGSTITIPSLEIGSTELESLLQQQFPSSDILVRTITSSGTAVRFAIDSDIQTKEDLDKIQSYLLDELKVPKDRTSVEVIGSALGESFFRQMGIVMLIAFLCMGLIVFFYYRSIAPSMAVISAALSDIIVTWAIFNLTGMKLTTAGIAAFLMLIQYSVDTDMLLSTRVLKRGDKSIMEQVYSSIKTGMTMTGTTFSAALISYFFIPSDVVKEIMLILCIGLVVDLAMTWIQNVALLRLYLEHKGVKQ